MHAAHAASWPSWSVSSCGGLPEARSPEVEAGSKRKGRSTDPRLHRDTPLRPADEAGSTRALAFTAVQQRAVHSDAEVEAGSRRSGRSSDPRLHRYAPLRPAKEAGSARTLTSTAVQHAVAEVEAGADALTGHEPSPPPRYAATTLVAPAVDLSPPALVRVKTCRTLNVFARRRTPTAPRARCTAPTSIRNAWLRYFLDDSICATHNYYSPAAARAQ